MSEVKVIDLYPDEEYSTLTETYTINKFTKIPKPVRVPNKRHRTLLALHIGESFKVEGYRKSIASWVYKHGIKMKRKFVTRSLGKNMVEIYRVA